MECIADGHVTVIRAEPSYLDPRYLYYQLSSQQFYDYVYSALVVGATNQIELNREKLMGARIRIPALDEQRRIADFLDAETARIDDLRRLTQEQLALLEERLLQLTRELTTGQTTSKRPTGIPWMPFIASSWRLGKVAHLFQTGSGTTPTASNSAYFDGGLPWINSADLHDGHIVGTSRSISRAAVRDFPALKEHPVGSLVVAMYGQGETKGRVGILDIPAFVNQACCVLIPTEVLTSDYASYWFRGHKNGIASLALGAGQPNLSQDLIRELRMPVPGEEAQRELVSRLTQAESLRGSQRNALLRRNSLLAERRQALITAAVTGQFDVTTAHGVDVP
jgi:type I restriction enzyme S subunit